MTVPAPSAGALTQTQVALVPPVGTTSTVALVAFAVLSVVVVASAYQEPHLAPVLLAKITMIAESTNCVWWVHAAEAVLGCV